MKAIYNGTVLAEAATEDLIKIEGNWYFPPAALTPGVLEASPTPYRCPWKGTCQYWSARIDDAVVEDLAWSYPEPYTTAIGRVGADFSGFVAFDPRVSVAE